MNLYYYSLSQKKFLQFYPGIVDAEKLEQINRFQNKARGLLWFAAYPLYIGGGALVTWWAKDAVLAALMKAVAFLAWVFFQGASWFLLSMGMLLDLAIGATISSDLYNNLSVINVGWTTVRDFSNMFFIFALLYIAIKTILGLAGGSTKRWVANLIIAALLINFSLFATKVVIDAGNILAMGFWEKMSITQGGVTAPSASLHLLHGLKQQTAFDPKDANGKPLDVEDQKKAMIYFGAGLTMLIAGYVFLAGAIMMIVRTVTLIMLMIFSPFAFLSFALPVGGSFANKWLSKLIGSTFVAPAFLAMLYLDTIIINSLDLAKLTTPTGTEPKFAGAFSGDMGSFPIIYNFFFIIILLLASLTVASSVSSGAGAQGGALAKKFIGAGAGAGLAGAGMAGRQTIGRWQKSKLNDKNWVATQNARVAKGSSANATFADKAIARAANAQLAAASKASKATFDGRNSKLLGKALGLGGVSTGAGTTKSYATHGQVGSSITGAYRGTEKEKELIATAKDRYSSDPEAQKAFLEQRGVQLDEKRNKDVKSELDRGVQTKTTKDNFKKQSERYEKALEDKELSEADLIKLEKEVALEMKTLLGKLSGKETAELLTQKQLQMAPVIAALKSKDLTALNAKAGELTPETIKAITDGVVQNGTADARNYMKSQAKIGGQFTYDAEANLTSLTEEYNVEQKKFKEGEIDEAAFNAYATKQKGEIGKALGMVGGANEIKELSDAIITHEAVVSQYNGKVVRELTKKIADIDGANSPLAKQFESQVSEHNTHAQEQATATQKNARAAAAARSAPKATVIPLTPPPPTTV